MRLKSGETFLYMVVSSHLRLIWKAAALKALSSTFVACLILNEGIVVDLLTHEARFLSPMRMNDAFAGERVDSIKKFLSKDDFFTGNNRNQQFICIQDNDFVLFETVVQEL